MSDRSAATAFDDRAVLRGRHRPGDGEVSSGPGIDLMHGCDRQIIERLGHVKRA